MRQNKYLNIALLQCLDSTLQMEKLIATINDPLRSKDFRAHSLVLSNEPLQFQNQNVVFVSIGHACAYICDVCREVTCFNCIFNGKDQVIP